MLSAPLSMLAILITLNSFIDITCIYHSSPTAVVFYTAENFPTGFAVLPIMLPQSSVPRYQTQPPKPTATNVVQRHVYRLLVKFSRATGASSFDHTMLVSVSLLFHDKFRTLSTIHQAYDHSKLQVQPTLTEVPTILGL